MIGRNPVRCSRPSAALLVTLGGALLVAVFGCGVKGPPVPPRQPALPAVVELDHRTAGTTVTLTWRTAAPLTGGAAHTARYVIYRSRTDLTGPACDTCPLVFEKIATVAHEKGLAPPYAARLPLEAGYRYTFKVRLEAGGLTGPDSPTVQFDYPSAVGPASDGN